ncbi:MAG: LamG-like jellyroll fold domain-containing protein, partial [Planctomycetota bacterium]
MNTTIRALFVSQTAVLSLIVSSSDNIINAQEPSVTTAVRWWEEYSGENASGPDVLGFWRFDGDATSFLKDSSSHGHASTLNGAVQNASGRFGSCLESSAGHPIADKSHSVHVKRSPLLSPPGPFTVELWIKPKDETDFPRTLRPVLLDSKYVTYDHSGFMLSLSQAGSDGTRRLTLSIGTGATSHSWYSQPIGLQPGVWKHIAFTYDARGTVAFHVDGDEVGRSTEPAAGAMAASTRTLSIGDRIGSLYNGFPGFIDEVRITRGVREFRPVQIVPSETRPAIVRMTENATLKSHLINQTGTPLEGATVSITNADGQTQRVIVPHLEIDAVHPLAIPLPSSLKPGRYSVRLSVDVPNWAKSDEPYRSSTQLPFVITRRPLPHQMPVVMWGIGGTDGVIREIPRLKEIGFTHCLGLRCDFQQVWDQGAGALPGTPEVIRQNRDMLNTALKNDIRIVAQLSPGSWLRRAVVGKPFLRIDRNGNHYGREDISGLFPPVREFCFNTGAAMTRAYGDHPAFASALLHTEVRGESQVSFHPLEIDAYREATGNAIPDEVTIKNGVQWQKLKDFPSTRVIPDDHPVLQYLTWFWKHGDGWNALNTQLHEGLQKNVSHDDFWSFHDPAVRVPSISGSGGKADVLSHWTYSYPDPVRIGLCTDELFEMARVNGHGQDVMKMTQVIWYRSQTAPKGKSPTASASPWVDQDPDADYITIAPMHLREAFWWKIARPIKGIMYHGWHSLVDTDSPGAYRYTNPNTRHELKRLITDVVKPLGPSLIQIPDAKSDVVFLESFTSQMFARRGTYGWNHTWAGDMYHILMYAQLQPRVMYEESLLKGDLDGAKVLVMADCDILTESVVRRIQDFQARGGLIVGDADTCPAIKPDFVIRRFARTKEAAQDRAKLLEAAANLRGWLDSRYQRTLDSSNPNVV